MSASIQTIVSVYCHELRSAAVSGATGRSAVSIWRWRSRYVSTSGPWNGGAKGFEEIHRAAL